MALSPSWELAFLTEQMPIHSGSGARDFQTNVHLGGQEQRQRRGTAQMHLEPFLVVGVSLLLSLPSTCECRQSPGETNN